MKTMTDKVEAWEEAVQAVYAKVREEILAEAEDEIEIRVRVKLMKEIKEMSVEIHEKVIAMKNALKAINNAFKAIQ